MPDYINPGVAAADSLSQFLAQREATKRQHMLDNITLAKQQQEAQQAKDEAEYRKQDLKLRADALKQSLANQQNEADEKKAKNVMDTHQKGDIYDAATVDLLNRTGNSGRVQSSPVSGGVESVPNAPVFRLAGQSAPALTALPDASGAAPVAPSAPIPAVGGPISVDRGTPAQQVEDEYVKGLTEMKGKIPANSPIHPYLDWGIAMKGKLPPESLAAVIKASMAGEGQDNEAVFQQNPRTGKVERLQNGQWTAWNGDVPKGAHFMTVPAPPSNTPVNVFTMNPDGTLSPAGSMPHGSRVVTPPGAAQAAVKEADKKDSLDSLNQLDQAINEAKDFIGPGTGRVETIEQMIGNPDPKFQKLAAKIMVTKLKVDRGIGGLRAAASPALMARWDHLLAEKMTYENLKEVTQAMREEVGGMAATPTSTSSAPDPYDAYLASHKAKP